MSLLAQYWNRITNARLLAQETSFVSAEWSCDIGCLTVEFRDADADQFPKDRFKDHNNRLEFENDDIHMGWVFHVDCPYDRFKPEPDKGTTKLSFKLSPDRVATNSSL